MNKQEFLTQLRKELSGLPQNEIEERIAFYGEMIDDRVDEGLSEENAVAEIGSVSDIAAQIISEIPLSKIAKEKIKLKRRLKAWEVVLLAVGSPIWLSLLAAAFAVVFSVYVSLWAVVVSLWACFASCAACVPGGAAGGVVMLFSGNTPAGLAMLAAGVVCAGLSVFAFYGCKAATKGMVLLTKKMALWMKKCFVKKEDGV